MCKLIKLNGASYELPVTVATVTDLLKHLDMLRRPVLVERNLEPVLQREWEETPVHQDDRIELINLTAGG
ncbi:MAG: sulfur carrier protein ThiS [Verrucomicrobiales bacterium]